MFNLKNIKNYFKKKYQTFVYGFPDSDTWSLDITIATYVLPRLLRFKDINKQGIPSVFFAVKKGEYTEEEEKVALDAWHAALDEMIFAFAFTINEEKFLPSPLIDASKKEWKTYFDTLKIFEERKQRGLELFAKYYSNLWW